MQVNILEAKSQLSQLIKAAQAGEEVIIANRGAPVVRLVAVGPLTRTLKRDEVRAEIAPPQRPGGILKWLANHQLPAYALRTADEIDASIHEERNSWD